MATDFLHKLFRWADHNRYIAIGVFVGVLASFWLVGCAPTTASPLTGEPVTRIELKREIASQQAAAEAFVEKVTIADEDLAKKEQFRVDVVNTLGALGNAAASGTITPAGGINAILTLVLGGLAVGGLANGRRKDGVIKDLKKKDG